MSYRFQVLKAFIKKEIFQILRDPKMRMVLFVAPLIQVTLFGIALSSETQNIKLAMFAKPNDVLMNDLQRRAVGTKWFIPAQVTGQDPYGWISSGEADAVLVAPMGGVARAEVEGQGKIQFLINAQNSQRAQAIENYMKIISRTVFLPAGQSLPNGLKFDVRALYNPSFETSLFMVPGVMSMIVCLVTILLTSMAVAREKEVGTIETLTAAPIDALDLMLGKTIPFIIIGAVQLPLILIFAVLAFGLPIRGPLWMLAIASLFMIASTVSIGLLISTIAKNQQQAMFGGFMYLFPSYLLSGLMFPIENMPVYIQPFAYINPLTHYMALLRNILLVGGNFQFFIIHTGALVLIGVAVVFAAVTRFRRMLLS